MPSRPDRVEFAAPVEHARREVQRAAPVAATPQAPGVANEQPVSLRCASPALANNDFS